MGAFGGLSDLHYVKTGQTYLPPSMGIGGKGAGVAEVGTRMVLDGAALTNLEVLVNAQDGTVQGSLWQLLNKTTSPFGKVQICVRL